VLTVHPPGLLETAVWLDLLDPTPEEAAQVEAATGFAIPSRAALSEIETSSRLRLRDHTLYLSTPILSRGDTPDAELTPMGFILSPRALVTVRFVELRVFDGVATELAKVEHPSSIGVFALLLEAVVDRVADLLEAAGAELDGLSHQIFRSAGREKKQLAQTNARLRNTLASIGQLGDRLGKIRGSLLGIARIAPFSAEVAHDWIGPEFQSRLGAVRADVLSLADYETHLDSKNQFLLDAVLGFISTEQNDLFKILTIVSVVGVPPTLIASVYGMNFAIIPELHWNLGYPYALTMIVLSAVVPMLWFKWKGWW
jgi:magnesium transporter